MPFDYRGSVTQTSLNGTVELEVFIYSSSLLIREVY